MANTLYDKARQRLLEAQLNWLTDTVKCMLVDTALYTPNVGAHEFLSDVPLAARVGSAAVLSGKTTTGGAADANDVTFTAVAGPSVEALIFYKDGGSDATSPLIYYCDSAAGLPITPNGGDILVAFDNGTNKIFKP